MRFTTRFTGYGRMQWPDGQMYCGGWKQNKRWGRGIQTAADGTVVHCGQWKNNEPVGKLITEAENLDEWQQQEIGGLQNQISDSVSSEDAGPHTTTENTFSSELSDSGDIHSLDECRKVLKREDAPIVKLVSSARLVV